MFCLIGALAFFGIAQADPGEDTYRSAMKTPADLVDKQIALDVIVPGAVSGWESSEGSCYLRFLDNREGSWKYIRPAMRPESGPHFRAPCSLRAKAVATCDAVTCKFASFGSGFSGTLKGTFKQEGALFVMEVSSIDVVSSTGRRISTLTP